MPMRNKFIYLILVSSIFFNYEFFPLVALFLIIYFEIFKKDMSLNINPFFLKYIPAVFYFSKVIFALDERLLNLWKATTSRLIYVELPFIEFQQVLFGLKCKSVKFDLSYEPFYRSQDSWFPILSCDTFKVNHGPLSEILYLNIFDIRKTTLLFAAVLIFLFLKIYFLELQKIDQQHKYILFFVSLSPPVNFLIDRLNIDLLILIVIYYILQNYKKYNILKLVILFALSLYKLHPIFFIIGISVYLLVKKKIKIFVFHIISILFFTYLTLNWYLQTSSSIPYFSNQGLTYGLFSDVLFIEKNLSSDLFTSNRLIIFLVLFSTLLLTTIYIFSKTNVDSLVFDNQLYFAITFWFLGGAVYANNDYRLAFLFLITNFVIKSKSLPFTTSFLLIMFLNPLPVINNSSFFSMDFVNYLDLNFYFFTSIMTASILISIKNLFINTYKN